MHVAAHVELLIRLTPSNTALGKWLASKQLKHSMGNVLLNQSVAGSLE